MTGITWLHLSDWHEGIEKYKPDLIGCDRSTVCRALIRDIEKRRKISSHLAQVDFIIFSGDLTFSGEHHQYTTAKTQFLDEVLKASGCRRNCLFLVPGNHDLDRKRLEKLPQEIRESLPCEKPDDLDVQGWVKDWLEQQPDRELLLNPFAEYRRFVHSYTGQKSCDYGSLKRLNINGVKVMLLGLNSALMAGRHKNDQNEYDDKGFLIVGAPQMDPTLSRIRNIEQNLESQPLLLKIAVMHHPFEWLCQWDKDRIERLLRNTFHFVLQGHEHKGDATSIISPIGNCCLISAGSSFDRINYPNGYNFVHLDFDSQIVRVYFRKWVQNRNKWVADNDIAGGGKYSFSLHQSLQDRIAKLKQASFHNLDVSVIEHCKELSRKILRNEVVPFLGADINLCNRFFKEISDPWKWDINSKYPPTNLELAAYLDRKLAHDQRDKKEYLKEIRCPLCNPRTSPGEPCDPSYPLGFPPECPLNTRMVTRLQLQHVSQFWSEANLNDLNHYLISIYERKYERNCIHEFLAKLPSLIANYDPPSKSRKESTPEIDPTKYPLIVTVCADSTLELAFQKKRQPYDLISYFGNKFIHQRFDPQDQHDYEVRDIGEIHPEGDNMNWLVDRPVILRPCGPANCDDDPHDGRFTITEDQFINYFHNGIADLLPVAIWQKLTQSSLWFLGYSLSYWNLRGIVRQIGYNKPTEDSTKGKQEWYSVQEKTDTLDENLWLQPELRENRKRVQFYGDKKIPSLEKYIKKIDNQVRINYKKNHKKVQLN